MADIAATSVEQAWDRYRKLGARAGFEAHFFAHDCYAVSFLPKASDEAHQLESNFRGLAKTLAAAGLVRQRDHAILHALCL